MLETLTHALGLCPDAPNHLSLMSLLMFGGLAAFFREGVGFFKHSFQRKGGR